MQYIYTYTIRTSHVITIVTTTSVVLINDKSNHPYVVNRHQYQTDIISSDGIALRLEDMII